MFRMTFAMSKKWYIYFVSIIFIILIAACSSYNYSIEITDSSDSDKSLEIDIFAIPSDKLAEMKMITYNDFWMKVFKSNGEYPKYKQSYYFGPGSPKTQHLDYKDYSWSVWEDSNMDYLCITAYSPDFTDSSRNNVDWNQFVKLKHRNWWGMCSEKLDIKIDNGVLHVEE